MTGLRQLAGQTVIYGASSVIGRILNYVLVPLYTAVFSPAQYGVVTELYGYVAFLNILYAYGFETSYFRFSTKDGNEDRYFNTAQSSLLISSILFSGILIVLAEPISVLLGYEGHADHIIWLALILGIDALVVVPFARLRLENKAVRFASLKLINITLNIGLNVFFILFCPWWLNHQADGVVTEVIHQVYSPDIGIGYIFISNLIANGFFLVAFFPMFVKLRIRATHEWKKMMAYAAPLIIVGLASATNDMLSRVMLKYMLPEGFYPNRTSLEALGIFGACYKLSVFMTLAVQAFRYAFEPFLFSTSSDKESPVLLKKVMTAFVIFGSFSWLLISLLLPYIAPIFLQRKEYLEGIEIVPLLLGGGLFLGIFYNLSAWYKLTDKTIYGGYITMLGAFLTIILNIVLIPRLGYLGSSMATFVVYGVMMITSYLWGRKHYPVPYQVGRNLFYIGFAGVLIFGVYFWGGELTTRYITITTAILLFILVSWFLDIKYLLDPKRK